MNHLDFSLPEIRRMVDDTHKPVEVYERTPSGDRRFVVVCDECRRYWRCPSVVALREWREERTARSGALRAKLEAEVDAGIQTGRPRRRWLS